MRSFGSSWRTFSGYKKMPDTFSIFSRLRRLEVGADCLKLLEGRAKILHDFFCQDVGRRQASGVLDTFVPEPEDVQVRLVPLHQFFVGERAEALCLLPVERFGVKSLLVR